MMEARVGRVSSGVRLEGRLVTCLLLIPAMAASEDRWPHKCSEHAANGWCSKKWVNEACPVSCATTTTPPGDQTSCPKHVVNGGCSKNWVKSACPISCAGKCEAFPPLPIWFKDEDRTGFTSALAGVIDSNKEAHAERMILENKSRPFLAYTTPLFPDLDGDGTVEFVNANHAYQDPWCGEVSPTNTSNAIEFDLGACEINRLRPIWLQQAIDDHSAAILDIDRDGFLDMYLNAGGGGGKGVGLLYASTMMWGEEANISTWAVTGGSEAATAAGLANAMGSGRGRSQYWADFNGDGMLDVCLLNKARKDTLDGAHSRILYNNGDRTFTEDPMFAEFVNVGILASSKGVRHGDANDFIVQRSKCMEQLDDDVYSDARIDFCAKRPTHSWAVYRYNKVLQHMELRYDTDSDPTASAHEMYNRALRVQSVEVNADSRMDLLVQTLQGVLFLYTHADQWLFQTGVLYQEHILPPKGYVTGACAVSDFNLDGYPDLIVTYIQRSPMPIEYGEFMTRMYTRDPDATSPPYWVMVQEEQNWPVSQMEVNPTPIEDYTAIDYNNDGYRDVNFVLSQGLYFLTNTFHAADTTCIQPHYLAVVLRAGLDGCHNEYGIGATISLRAAKVGKNGKKEPARWFHQDVSSFSHGTTYRGGATDHRNVFGLGAVGVPKKLRIKWCVAKIPFTLHVIRARLRNIVVFAQHCHCM